MEQLDAAACRDYICLLRRHKLIASSSPEDAYSYSELRADSISEASNVVCQNVRCGPNCSPSSALL
jgi:hypothetical protein